MGFVSEEIGLSIFGLPWTIGSARRWRSMKLRINRNSLRFRLSPADLERLDDVGAISEKAEFAPGVEFSYMIRARSAIHAIRANLDANSIIVEIPTSMVSDWRQSDTVGLHHTQPLDNGSTLDVLIEKDFECLDEKMNEPGVVLYPNPNKESKSGEESAGDDAWANH
jgi:hypothetical protein